MNSVGANSWRTDDPVGYYDPSGINEPFYAELSCGAVNPGEFSLFIYNFATGGTSFFYINTSFFRTDFGTNLLNQASCGLGGYVGEDGYAIVTV